MLVVIGERAVEEEERGAEEPAAKRQRHAKAPAAPAADEAPAERADAAADVEQRQGKLLKHLSELLLPAASQLGREEVTGNLQLWASRLPGGTLGAAHEQRLRGLGLPPPAAVEPDAVVHKVGVNAVACSAPCSPLSRAVAWAALAHSLCPPHCTPPALQRHLLSHIVHVGTPQQRAGWLLDRLRGARKQVEVMAEVIEASVAQYGRLLQPPLPTARDSLAGCLQSEADALRQLAERAGGYAGSVPLVQSSGAALPFCLALAMTDMYLVGRDDGSVRALHHGLQLGDIGWALQLPLLLGSLGHIT